MDTGQTGTPRPGESDHPHLSGGAGTDPDDQSGGFTIWLTGLSGTGKSTIASILETRLRGRGLKVEVLDGDVVRTNLTQGLGFSKQDRETNVRRVAWVCALLSRNDVVAIAAVISPYRSGRDEARHRIGRFVEIHMDAPLHVLEERDVKGLYRRARAGEIPDFTGVTDDYEPPLDPELTCLSDGGEAPDVSADRILAKLHALGYLTSA
ncbi:MAG: adenylyl-sulfate kinase [Chloroflexi bacterium]|nr:adenylyl-sulfate kinase [Chloroflexota bacterium]